ncbi:hypothetical protein ACFQKF_08850 [Halalkalicoccus sp. GCM10025322]
MTRKRLLAIAAGVATIVGTNLYWWQRLETTRDAVAVSRERDREVTAATTGSAALLERAAELAGTTPEELPEAIEALEAQRSDAEKALNVVKTDLGDARSRWARRWWEARTASGFEGPETLVVTIEGESDDAQALAKRATEYNDGVTVVVAEPSNSFVVSAGDAAECGADEIARRIADRAGGGAGGSSTLATGGGASDDLRTVVDELTAELSV